ncbi:MAG: carbohydrate-binding protein, partial [Oscillospiraceae bacterium]|nr:carbohydrate-binding protein [Oscillospiraceae bacterium]
MKKFPRIILATVLAFALVSLMATSVGAAAGTNNPFARMTATEDNVEGGTNGSHDTMDNPDALYDASKLFHLYWDTDPDTWHAAGLTIAFLDPYGIGYCHTNSVVYVENLDFGANGADKLSVSLTNAATEDMGSLNVYLDVNPVKDKSAQPIGTTVCGTTDGFEQDYAKDFDIDVNIPGGVHTVYFMFTSNTVGSFFGVQFNEAPPPPTVEEVVEVEEAPAPLEEAPAPAAPAPASPPT